MKRILFSVIYCFLHIYIALDLFSCFFCYHTFPYWVHNVWFTIATSLISQILLYSFAWFGYQKHLLAQKVTLIVNISYAVSTVLVIALLFASKFSSILKTWDIVVLLATLCFIRIIILCWLKKHPISF